MNVARPGWDLGPNTRYPQLAPTFHRKWRLRCCTPKQMRGWLAGPWPGDMRPTLARFCEEACASVCQELAEQGLCVRADGRAPTLLEQGQTA